MVVAVAVLRKHPPTLCPANTTPISTQRCHDAPLFCLLCSLCLLLACPLFMLLRRRRSNITCLTIPAPIRAARQGILQEERQSHASRTGIVKSLWRSSSPCFSFSSLLRRVVALQFTRQPARPANLLTRLADAGGLPALEAQRRAESAPLPALLSILLQPRSTAHPLA